MNNPDTQATLGIRQRTKINKTQNTTQKSKKVEDPTKNGGGRGGGGEGEGGGGKGGGEPRCFLEDNNLDNNI